MKELRAIIARNRNGSGESLPSICSAHPDVIAASALFAQEMGRQLLIEATSNQVNQFGGYTGLEPAQFIEFVRTTLRQVDVEDRDVLFGGDHLGPQAWRGQPADIAMAQARELVAAYVRAGFTKIHLDCSEGCAGEPAQVSDDVSASRAAELAAVCEGVASDPSTLSYVYGTEVPPPGGARATDDGQGVAPTKPGSARKTIEAHRRAFLQRGLGDAWARAIGLVVQPGLEFAPDHVHPYDRSASDTLSEVLQDHPRLSFEAHSTDYQHPDVYPALGRRHFAVLKVGPALTFAYRQAIYGLDAVADWVHPDPKRQHVSEVMEGLMLDNPAYWEKHYSGTERELILLRHFSYADRIRYCWTQPAASLAVAKLMLSLPEKLPPNPLLEQYFSAGALGRAARLEARLGDWRRALIYGQIQEALAPYFYQNTGSEDVSV